MKPVAYAAVLLGLVSAALGQVEDPGPSPTESYGCEPHGDHWHCEGPRETSTVDGGAATSAPAVITSAITTSVSSSASHDDDDHDHDHTEEHTDAAGTGSLAPSPTESYGCEPHGDHWHCEGARTALTTGSSVPSASGSSGSSGSTLSSATITSAPTGASASASTSPSPSTAGAAHYEVAGLGFAGIAAIAAMAL